MPCTVARTRTLQPFAAPYKEPAFASLSVAAGRVMTYKAFNTFVDDAFAILVAMPMHHKIACLRDDLVFLIFLYQRWLYPVDKRRANEYGIAYEREEEEEGEAEGSEGVAAPPAPPVPPVPPAEHLHVD